MGIVPAFEAITVAVARLLPPCAYSCGHRACTLKLGVVVSGVVIDVAYRGPYSSPWDCRQPCSACWRRRIGPGCAFRSSAGSASGPHCWSRSCESRRGSRCRQRRQRVQRDGTVRPLRASHPDGSGGPLGTSASWCGAPDRPPNRRRRRCSRRPPDGQHGPDRSHLWRRRRPTARVLTPLARAWRAAREDVFELGGGPFWPSYRET